MPELPEVETVRRGLVPMIVGKRISRVTLYRANLRTLFPKTFVKTLEGSVITGLRRRAKYILADLDQGSVWLMHLGMSGSFRGVKGPFTPEAHDHVVVSMDDGLQLVFNDPRRFGQMDVFDASDETGQKTLAGLGPEPLDKSFDGPALYARLAGKTVAVKVALLDQGVVAGVGNIYACEALFAAHISPRRPAGKVTKKEAGVLAQAIKDVMNAALKSGGSSLRNHRQVDGNLGYFQHHFAVYDHAGAPCGNCTCGGKRHVETMTQGGRTTFFCPVKQR